MPYYLSLRLLFRYKNLLLNTFLSTLFQLKLFDMVRYTNEEKRDMYEVYIKLDRNSFKAQQRYGELYPERQTPNIKMFRRLSTTLLDHNAFIQPRGPYVRRNEPVNDINVLAQIRINPGIGSRTMARDCNLSKSSVNKILKRHGYHDYKYQAVQKLYHNDPERRLQFCNWFQRKVRNNNNFAHNIIWGDETTFTNSGMFNRRNKHFYATENPYLINEVRHQYRFSLNIWCGLWNNKLLGPYFIDGNLTGAKYVEIIEEMLDDLPIRYRRNRPWFQQDGCGPHNSRIVTDYLNRTFPDSWIGTRGPVAWPARSPDLNPLDFYLWGHLKNKIYDTTNPTIEILREKIENVLEGIQGDEISTCIRSMSTRTAKCILQNGGHFEHLLY